MQEQIVAYSGKKRKSWLTNKCQGLVNRYFNARRNLLWRLHLWRHPIGLDRAKLLPGSMPIFINNYNRLETLRAQLDWLRKVNDPASFIIVDNGSDYLPLLAFYDSLDLPNVQVVRLGYNSWRKGVAHLSKLLNGFEKFVLTDPDLLPYTSTPNDVVSHLSALLDRYPAFNHIGLSLEINDLPDNALRETVQRHEGQFWPPTTDLLNEEVYVAAVDTTFAMYRRSSDVEALAPALRTARPYTLRHVDWYIQPSNVSEEYLHYLQSVSPVATWSVEIKKVLGLYSRHRSGAA
jgi:hypothetical protein